MTGCFDGSASIWNVEAGKVISQLPNAHRSQVWSVSFSPESDVVATGGGDHSIGIWDTLNGIEVYRLEASKSFYLKSKLNMCLVV